MYYIYSNNIYDNPSTTLIEWQHVNPPTTILEHCTPNKFVVKSGHSSLHINIPLFKNRDIYNHKRFFKYDKVYFTEQLSNEFFSDSFISVFFLHDFQLYLFWKCNRLNFRSLYEFWEFSFCLLWLL